MIRSHARAVPSSNIVAVLSICILTSLLGVIDVAAQVSGGVYFPVGNGFTDGIPRQLVRTNQDRLYIFAPNAQYTNTVNVFWTTSTGLPAGTTSFNGTTSFTETAPPLSVDAVYDGVSTIHVLVNTNGGSVKDYPFNTITNTFRLPITVADNVVPNITGDYIGTVGVSGMVDKNGLLHVVYWSDNNRIVYQAYTYNPTTNILSPSGGSTEVDTAGSANHPIVAVSPLDNSVTVAWVSEASPAVQILARRRSSGGAWGAIEIVSAATPWTSTSAGINIDQGPSLVITPDGTRHLLYIENYDNTNSYGRVHYVTNNGSGWTDTPLNFYSHNPGLATNGQGDIYLIGHGAVQAGVNENTYVMKKNSNGSWQSPQLFATPPPNGSFDASPSIKWSVVGFKRPETLEFAFFNVIGGSYNTTAVYYGRFPAAASPVSNVPIRNFYATRTPTLTWNRVSWAIGYQLQLDNDANFLSVIDSIPAEFPVSTLSFTTPELANGIYYWRVRAKKNATDWGNWSPTISFTVAVP